MRIDILYLDGWIKESLSELFGNYFSSATDEEKSEARTLLIKKMNSLMSQELNALGLPADARRGQRPARVGQDRDDLLLPQRPARLADDRQALLSRRGLGGPLSERLRRRGRGSRGPHHDDDHRQRQGEEHRRAGERGATACAAPARPAVAGRRVRCGPARRGEHRHEHAEAERAAELLHDVDQPGRRAGVPGRRRRRGRRVVSGAERDARADAEQHQRQRDLREVRRARAEIRRQPGHPDEASMMPPISSQALPDALG